MKTEDEHTTIANPERQVPQTEKHAALVFLRGDLIAAPIPLEREKVILGRALEADVRINDAKASRLHARISVERDPKTAEQRYRICDLGSTNGTLLNGQPVLDAFLKDGDKLTIGEHMLRFELLDDIDREFQTHIHRLLGHDELTGLLTSKSFLSELKREAKNAENEQRPFCVLMMDLDHFKSVNDRYGHLVGSQTLEDVGSIIMRSLRAGDVAARFGGEEFAAFLLNADCAQGLVAAERVRSSVEEFVFSAVRRGSTADVETSLRITISVGVAAFPNDARDPIQLIELADTALYRAKNTGRNRVCSICEPSSDPSTGEPSPLRSRQDRK